MKSNFEFLHADFPVLAALGLQAETYCFSDPNACLMKLGMMGETVVNLMFTYDKIKLPYDNTAAARIDTLRHEDLLTRDLTDILHVLRKARNKAVHENYASVSDCKSLLEMAYSLCEWFMQTYGDWNYQHRTFIPPMPTHISAPISVMIRQEEEEKTENLAKQAEEIAAAAKSMPKSERSKQASKMASQRLVSEAETRYMIDEQLRQVGWEADTENLRYAKGTRPAKGHNRAISEWPTNSATGQSGRADYALFIGTKMVGMIEAKAAHIDIPSVLDYQGKDYPRSIREEDKKYVLGTWGEYLVPFTFATNGRSYLEQVKTKSGVWFLDLRDPSNTPKALHGWISPAGIEELLEKDVAAGNQALKSLPYDFLTDPSGLNLRPYQVNAVKAAEQAVTSGRENILLAMATGTGKTRTVLGMIYRFLTTNRFKRILFLVDRTSLGQQAADVFKEVKLEDLMTLDQIYDIKGLDDKDIDKSTRIHIATVQSMVKRILYGGGDSTPAVTDYDLIIIDEAHRGYTLDKEMSEAEFLYQDQRDYQSKYRSVITYFDAVRVALTATPALQTTEIFGEPVFKYTYREAVIEGYLVDHDAPHILQTKLSTEGIHFKKGDNIAKYDPITGEITNSELLDDELDFDVEQFNRQVITESFNQTVLSEIARGIDPEAEGKTLIYAANDAHADMIVQLLREIYAPTGVHNDAIMKITGSVGGGDPKKVQEAIKRFKNERYPSIAVTVDLLTTGIDVPEITTLVFMRRVKSRILFEQMLGRATRLCPKIHKTHFSIYDPVGVYESLGKVNTMKPVAVNPNVKFTNLLGGLNELTDDAHIEQQVKQIIAKLQRKKHSTSDATLTHFRSMTGGNDFAGFISEIEQKKPQDAKKYILAHHDLFKMLEESTATGKRSVIISDKEDELKSHTLGYGNAEKPEDYLEAFAKYIKDNRNEIAALSIICTSPGALTWEALRDLRLTLDREGFKEIDLNKAIRKVNKKEITADLISLIRRYAIGARLISHEARIRRAVTRLREAHDFSAQELNWISRIETYLMNESVLNVHSFNGDNRFKREGGFNRINKIFQNNLESIVCELNEYLYDDGGETA